MIHSGFPQISNVCLLFARLRINNFQKTSVSRRCGISCEAYRDSLGRCCASNNRPSRLLLLISHCHSGALTCCLLHVTDLIVCTDNVHSCLTVPLIQPCLLIQAPLTTASMTDYCPQIKTQFCCCCCCRRRCPCVAMFMSEPYLLANCHTEFLSDHHVSGQQVKTR